ncbi:MAG: hypothetical protein EOM80_09240 [Erysipelotrichia bacterium]|nr:hypothetical protein [Erysipelotrichia bacterium]
MPKHSLVLTILLSLVLCVAFADSEGRPATEIEKAFYSRVIDACKGAVAGVKIAWEQTDISGEDQSDYDNVAVGCENSALSHHFYVEWSDQKRIENSGTEISEALAAKIPEAQDIAQNADMKRLEELGEEVAAAADAGNFAEVERLTKEAEIIAARGTAAFSETDKKMGEIIEKMAPRDARAVIRIGVNQFYQDCDLKPVTGKLDDGTEFCRVENGRLDNETWVEGTSYVALGKGWKMNNNESIYSLERAAENGRPHTSIQSLIVAVEAEQKRALEILNSMNLGILKALIEN